MGAYKYLQETWRTISPEAKLARLMQLRKEPALKRVVKPTKIHRAHALGYKAKQGYLVVRVKLSRAKRQREHITGGRRTRHMRHKKIVSKSYRWIAEERANRKYRNCEVLNSYKLAEDGKHFWFEVILVDRDHPVIKKGKETMWVAAPANRGRVFRGLTSAGRKSRGLRRKGKGAEKVRPSQRAHKRLAH